MIYPRTKSKPQHPKAPSRLTIAGTLVMGSGGQIRNSNDSYRLDAGGLRIRGGVSWSVDRAINFTAGGDISQIDARIWYGTGIGGGLVLETAGAAFDVRVQPSGQVVMNPGSYVNCLAPVRVPSYTTAQMNNISSPQVGMVIYNTTAERLAWYRGSGAGGWMHVQGSTDRF